MKSLLPVTAIAATLFSASAAFAAPAQVTSTLNLRTGPSTRYRVETAMPAGAVVDVAGCTQGYGWCRVRWNGYDGWASSNYLASRQTGYSHRRFNSYGAEIGIPLIAGAVIGGVLGNHDHHDRNARHHAPRHGTHTGHSTRRQHDNDHGGHRHADKHGHGNQHGQPDRRKRHHGAGRPNGH